jgi:hypothetical protein
MASSSNTPPSTETNPSPAAENPNQHIPAAPMANPNQNILIAPLANFAQNITKLNKSNFLTWHGLVKPFLRGHDLYGFIDGTNTPPSPLVISSPDGALTFSTDLDTLRWLRQDQLILSMLMSSISDDLLPHVLGCKTAQDLWQTLNRTFTFESRARTMTFHYQLATTKKGTSSISDYFQQLKHTAATLAAAGQPLNDYEFTSYLLTSLGPEYDPFVTSVTTRIEPLFMDDLFGHLLAHETRIAKHHQNDALFPTANVAPQSPSHHRGRGGHHAYHHNSSNGPRPWGRGYQSHAPASGNFGGHQSHSPSYNRLSRSSGYTKPNSSSPRPICQVCGRMGHIALAYHHRFDQAYQAASPSLTTYAATSFQSRDLNWYPDTGATHHVTSNLNNLNLQSEEYDGPDHIQVGNGTRLAIKNTGTSILPPSNFILRHVLHVPKITKNLLSVQKFTSDNNAFMEFHPSCFFVKDQTSGRILHKGSSKHGLYHWSPSPIAAPPSVFSSERASPMDWHAHLSHPADRILRQVVSKFHLPVTSNKKLPLCFACRRGKSHQLPFTLSTHQTHVSLELIFSNV